ncbi:MAG: hypothetical protein WD333_05950 [Dehalococcoidia bacterium]
MDGIVVVGVNIPRGDLAGIVGGGLSGPAPGDGSPYPEPYFSSQRTGCEPPSTRTNCSAGSLSAPITGFDGFMQVVWHLSTQASRA